MENKSFQAVKWSRLGQNSAFGSIAMLDVAEDDDDIMVVGADIGKLIAIDRFKKKFPEKYLDVGIAEQNLVGISGGLALEGKCVFAVTYAAFISMRSFEFVRHLLSYMKTNVKLIGMMSGLALGSGGISHWAIEDIALMRSIPNIIVLSPSDVGQMVKMVRAVSKIKEPVYIRLTGGENCPVIYKDDFEYEVGKAIQVKDGKDVAIIATGLMVGDSIKAAELLEEKNISCAVYDMHTIKPIDEECLNNVFKQYKLVITVEEHNIIGGLGSAVAEFKAQYDNAPKLIRMGITDEYKETGTRGFILEQYNLTVDGIVDTIYQNIK